MVEFTVLTVKGLMYPLTKTTLGDKVAGLDSGS